VKLRLGRTLRAPILKLGVNCMAAISNEKVSCTDVCIAAVWLLRFGHRRAGALFTGAVGFELFQAWLRVLLFRKYRFFGSDPW